jgi:SAM-dependent methyltransferase
MHQSSYDHMADLTRRYLEAQRPLRILDIGSYDVNGSYKPLFSHPGWVYQGVDLSAGPNVDVVLQSAYRFPLPDNYADLIISGQAFEHVEYFWLTWLEMERVLKPGGMIFLIAPSRGPEHRYPVDCWRFYADGFTALAKYGRMDLLEVSTDWEPSLSDWGDTVGVFRKPQVGIPGEIRRRIRYFISRLLTPKTQG